MVASESTLGDALSVHKVIMAIYPNYIYHEIFPIVLLYLEPHGIHPGKYFVCCIIRSSG